MGKPYGTDLMCIAGMMIAGEIDKAIIHCHNICMVYPDEPELSSLLDGLVAKKIEPDRVLIRDREYPFEATP